MNNRNSVFKLYKLLDEDGNDKNKILKHLQIKLPTFYKNIEQLKSAGFKIKKHNGLYSLERYKKILELNNNEKSAIAYMLSIALNYLPKNKFNNFKNFIKKFMFLSSEDDYKEILDKTQLIEKYSLIEEYEEKIKLIEKYIAEKQNIQITTKYAKTYIIRPLKFQWKKDKAILYYINLSKDIEEKLSIDKIVKIEKERKQDYLTENEEIIFELYDNLSKKYLLREDERIIKQTKDSIVIASSTKDRDNLLKRLLRYDTLCKVLFPKHEVDTFNKLIDEAIINIDLEDNE